MRRWCRTIPSARMREDRRGIRTHRLAGEIVVGTSDATPAVDPDASDTYDVLLTTEADPPAPWVHGDLAELEAAVAASPHAAVTLVQVLRATEPSPVADALVVESLAYSMLQHGTEFLAWLDRRARRAPRPVEHEPLGLTRTGDRLEIVLRRPEVHNAVDAAMRDALCEAFDLVALDPGIGQVDVRGTGPSFCSGGDLDEFGTATDAALAHEIRVARSVGRRVSTCADRVAVHVHGACIGAGVEIAAFAGRVRADPATTFRLPEVAFGLIPGAGGTVSVPRRIGRHRTAHLGLTGQALDAETARAWGLVDEVAPVAPAG